MLPQLWQLATLLPHAVHSGVWSALTSEAQPARAQQHRPSVGKFCSELMASAVCHISFAAVSLCAVLPTLCWPVWHSCTLGTALNIGCAGWSA